MSVVLLLGCGLGAGLFVLVRGTRRRPVPIAQLLELLDRQAPSHEPGSKASARARVLAGGVEQRVRQRLALDLRAAGRTSQQHAATKLVGAVAAAGSPVLLHVLLALQGGGLAAPLLVATVGAGAVLGFTVPDTRLRAAARQLRAQFEHALSSYLDLVNVVLAGGAGIESALEAAAEAGDGWVFDELRQALVRARATRRSPWLCLGELGRDLGVDPLVELASSVQLAGEQGARIRASLAAKAGALRARHSTQLEADAHAASERMGIPTVLMFVGFLLLLGFPALQQIAGPEPAPTTNRPDTEVTGPWTP